MTGNTGNLEPAEIGDIVVGIDDSPSSVAAFNWAAEYARSTGGRLRAVYVFSATASSPLVWNAGFPAMAYVAENPAREVTQDTMAAMFRAAAPEPGWTLEFYDGPAGRQLVNASVGARLLVVGTREHVGLGRLISGSVSHYCLTHATCPVAAIPPSPRPDDRIAMTADHVADPAATRSA